MQQIAEQISRLINQLSTASITLIFLIAGGCLLLAVFVVFLLYLRLRDTRKSLARAELTGEKLRQQLAAQEIRAAKLITLLKNERKQHTEKLQLLEDAREQLRLQFASLAQQIFDDKTSRLTDLNREKLDAVLEPFNHQLQALKQEISEIYRTDSRERVALKHEIVHLRDLNQQINKEAANLTRALKSDTKLQGNWGELVLEKVLEHSGLRVGREYEVQGTFRDHQNRLLRPDVIVHLPDSRDIIIDSKVSLISWEKYVADDSEEQQTRHLNQLVKAIRDHITGLSTKGYPDLATIRSLDFVLMFMPIEAAFAAAVEHDEGLLTFALEKNIIIVTPTTLLATLRTVENLWRMEQQSKSSIEIARRAGLLYDKMVAFVEDMEKVGKQLSTCRTTYDLAINKLSRGRGNLISQAEQLRTLGVQAKKEMPAAIIETAETELKN